MDRKEKKDRVSLKFNRNEEKKNLIYGRYVVFSSFFNEFFNLHKYDY